MFLAFDGTAVEVYVSVANVKAYVSVVTLFPSLYIVAIGLIFFALHFPFYHFSSMSRLESPLFCSPSFFYLSSSLGASEILGLFARVGAQPSFSVFLFLPSHLLYGRLGLSFFNPFHVLLWVSS